MRLNGIWGLCIALRCLKEIPSQQINLKKMCHSLGFVIGAVEVQKNIIITHLFVSSNGHLFWPFYLHAWNVVFEFGSYENRNSLTSKLILPIIKANDDKFGDHQILDSCQKSMFVKLVKIFDIKSLYLSPIYGLHVWILIAYQYKILKTSSNWIEFVCIFPRISSFQSICFEQSNPFEINLNPSKWTFLMNKSVA